VLQLGQLGLTQTLLLAPASTSASTDSRTSSTPQHPEDLVRRFSRSRWTGPIAPASGGGSAGVPASPTPTRSARPGHRQPGDEFASRIRPTFQAPVQRREDTGSYQLDHRPAVPVRGSVSAGCSRSRQVTSLDVGCPVGSAAGTPATPTRRVDSPCRAPSRTATSISGFARLPQARALLPGLTIDIVQRVQSEQLGCYMSGPERQ